MHLAAPNFIVMVFFFHVCHLHENCDKNVLIESLSLTNEGLKCVGILNHSANFRFTGYGFLSFEQEL